MLQAELNQIAEKEIELINESLLQTGETQTAVAAAFAASLEKKKKKVETVPGKAMIQTYSDTHQCVDGKRRWYTDSILSVTA